MKTLDYPWDIFVGVSCPNQDAFGRRAQDLAVARDSFASPPRGTSLVLGAIRPSPHAGPLSGSGPAPPGRPARPALNVDLAWTPLCLPKLGARACPWSRPARPALNVCLAWTPFCIPKLGGHAHTHAHTDEQNAVDFSTGLGPHQAWTPLCLHSHIIRPHSS